MTLETTSSDQLQQHSRRLHCHEDETCQWKNSKPNQTNQSSCLEMPRARPRQRQPKEQPRQRQPKERLLPLQPRERPWTHQPWERIRQLQPMERRQLALPLLEMSYPQRKHHPSHHGKIQLRPKTKQDMRRNHNLCDAIPRRDAISETDVCALQCQDDGTRTKSCLTSQAAECSACLGNPLSDDIPQQSSRIPDTRVCVRIQPSTRLSVRRLIAPCPQIRSTSIYLDNSS